MATTRAAQRRLPPIVGLMAVLCAVVVAALSWLWYTADSRDGDELLRRSQAALRRDDFAAAEGLATRIGPDDAAWGEARLVAGEAASRSGRFDKAIAYYASVPRDGSATAVLADYSRAEVYRHLGRLSDAIQTYSAVLERQPRNARAHQKLAFLLELTGQRWRAVPHFMFLVRTGTATLEELVLIGDLERHLEQAEYLRHASNNAPDDPLVQLGLAAYAVLDGQTAKARRLVEDVVAREPDLVPAQAILGELLVNESSEAFLHWHARLPPEADEYPDIWFVRGLRARRLGRLRVAARCFWEAVRRAPAHRRSNYHLGQVLTALKETSGREFAERSRTLFQLSSALDDVLSTNGRHEETLKGVVRLMESTGRIWETCAWAGIASQTFPSAPWPREVIARWTPQLSSDTPRTLASANLALKHDLSDYQDHRELFADLQNDHVGDPAARSSWRIRFGETDAGIDFVYFNGPDPSTKGVRVFEQNGGGVAVLDVDLDGWPDLYFTQGCEWPNGATKPVPSPTKCDRLYRNLGGRRFVDVTADSGLVNRGFAQGPAVGDFNSDGFPDLYVANIGRNRLYCNNGDGTFSDVTTRARLAGDDWTVSCAVVDLNADSLPDLFDVNYLQGENVHTTICNGRACSPAVFAGTPDRLHINQGDGTFAFVPNATPEMDAKGLGLVAADIYQSGRPCLFIANDQVPNFLMRNVATDDPPGVRFNNEGFASGLAYNEDGLPMACMGIAADDADGNGLIDFFVTNFKDEANTLYLQDTEGLFIDATKAARLHAPSWDMVGWGTQFLDADLDGQADLVLVNGNVDDYRDEGGQYHMRPQFFRNTGRGRFVEVSRSAGPFFEREFLGRGLARLDWNRDGKMDFAVSNIGDPASLITNQSAAGHYLQVRLHATNSARDAIGAVVTAETGQSSLRKQLTAGDGYQASNERMLEFGLGTSQRVRRLKVEWPSGATITLSDLPANRTVELVEGAPFGTLWNGAEPTSLSIAPPIHEKLDPGASRD